METNVILVGVDGSASSLSALRWSISEARIRSARIRALHCWAYPATYAIDVYIPPDRSVLEAEAMAVLEHAITQAVEGLDPVPDIERVIRDGSPSHALIEESAKADLVVVGARGHGGFIGLLLGSVASQCISHASRPTVVVPK